MKKAICLSIIMMNVIVAMDDAKFKVVEIATPEQIHKGMELVTAMHAKALGVTSLSEVVDKNAYLKEKIDQLTERILTTKDEQYAHVYNKDKLSGFIALHIEEKRIMIDTMAYADEKEALDVFKTIVAFLKESQKDAKSLWTVIRKENTFLAKFLYAFEFKESLFMDKVHNPKVYQGYERAL